MVPPSSDPTSRQTEDAIIGATEAIREARRLVALAASRGADVLVVGERGTGKELVARAVHGQGSGAKNTFLRIEASAPAGELDGKLFGPKAPQTTIYLREVGDLAPSLQPHLRAALEERDSSGHAKGARFANVRLVCGSTTDLGAASRKGSFDAMLLRRISACVIQLPPLRSRREDIPLLVAHFVRLLKNDIGHQVDSFSPETLDVLMQKSWPGNVRELYEHVRTTVILSPTSVIEPADLWPRPDDGPGGEPWHLGYRELRKRVLLRFETDFVARMLRAAGGNVSLAARLAKIDRKHLWRLIQRTGIKLDRFAR
jgi:DNA-binding NtrC family response regulator